MVGCRGACHKSFERLEDARAFLNDNVARPLGRRQLFHPLNTPAPPAYLNPHYADDFIDEEEEVGDDRPQGEHESPDPVPVQVTLSMPAHVIAGPPGIPEADYQRLVQFGESIAADQSNVCVDPVSFICPNGSNGCGFCTGDLWEQRYNLMLRLYQINAMLLTPQQRRAILHQTVYKF